MANIWRLIAHHENAADVVALIRKTGQIWIGWGETGDLSQSAYRSGSDISRVLHQIDPTRTNSGFGGASLWRFYHDMQIGDLVIVSSKQGKQLTAEVTGPYQWQSTPGPAPLTSGYQHHRVVSLTSLDPGSVFAQAGGMAVGENSRWTLFRCANSIVP